MSDISDLTWFSSEFEACDLASLNDGAAMLTRIDNKYIVQAVDLGALVASLAEGFDVLEIGDRRAFNYATRYFDDDARNAYYEHHQGKRKGFKVRSRRYLDAGLCYVELKMKEKRGTTIKHRLEYDYDGFEALNAEALQFVKNGYRTHYGKNFTYKVRPVLDIRYQRLTLVSKDRGERLTIDTDLTFSNGTSQLYAPRGIFIIETKSRNGRGHADRCLRAQHHYPIKRCSKYCIGMAALSEVTRFNHFMPTIRKLKIWDAPVMAVTSEQMVA
ncbi:VTC domain-containing protein [Roseovarius marisflavi]|uniref:VTC domain-containing protein n=1 Tax=Roseovarius marisflavi TaxID=1054996 RepID=A0A1M6WZH3_9RHOB|nr:polyphosphate polymerase domain-containing protein [Roseovarius marisflavi]SHK99150.1 VTC domain-containing protein [Roseovarius marisflavi]